MNLTLFLLSAVLFHAPCAAPQEPAPQGLAEGPDAEEVPVDQTLVVINDDVITWSMVQERAGRLMRIAPELSPGDAQSLALRDWVIDLLSQEGLRRMGLDPTLMDEEATLRMQRIIEETGSRARFEEQIAREGIDLETWRRYLRNELVNATFRRIMLGMQPSPLEGIRNRTLPRPEEVRRAFEEHPEEWTVGEHRAWLTLQFFDSDQGTGLERAQAVANGLAQGTMTVDEAKALADSVRPGEGDPRAQPLRSDLRRFLVEGQAGEVGDVDPIEGLGAQVVVLTEVQEAREIGFDEAQEMVAQQLRRDEEERILADAYQHLARTSYLWYINDLEGFMTGLLGIEADRAVEF